MVFRFSFWHIQMMQQSGMTRRKDMESEKESDRILERRFSKTPLK